MEASFFTRHPFLKDALNIAIFVICVVIGTILVNSYVFRSFNVLGPSMQPTLHTSDRLIVNRLPVTWAQLQNKAYIPERGQVIVFKNPHYTRGIEDEFIVKRVIGLPGERVVLKDGKYTVYNNEVPGGFDPTELIDDTPAGPDTRTIETLVPSGELFVAGDNRVGNYSYDSRSGLGTVPLYDVIGPVSMRIFPFNQVRGF